MGRPRKYPLVEQKLDELRNVENPNQMEISQVNLSLLEQPIIATINNENKTVTITESKQEKSVTIELVKKNIPSIVRKRNEYGFLENVDYVFKEDGKVDWRKMIKPE